MSVFYICLRSTDRLWIKGKAYRSAERLKGWHFLFNEDMRTVRAWTDDELDHLILAGEVRIERHPILPASSPPPASDAADAARFAQLPRPDSEHLFRHELFCRCFLEMERAGEAKRSDAAMHRAIAIIHAEMKEAAWRATGRLRKAPYSAGQIVAHPCPPSVRTLRRALKSLEHSGCPGIATAARAIRRAK